MAIATGTALGIAAAASAGSSVYASKRAGKTNDKAMAATERSDERAATIERESQERAERAERERLAHERERLAEERAAREARLAEDRTARESRERRDDTRWADYLRINEPMWRAGAGVLGNLYDIAGYGAGSAPQFAMPNRPPASGGDLPPIIRDGLPPGVSGKSGQGPIAGQQTMRARRPMPTMPPPVSTGINLNDLMMLAQASGSGGMSPGNGAKPFYGGSIA